MKNGRFEIRLDYHDKFKLDWCCDKLGLQASELIRSLIDVTFHDLNPPFREYST